MSRNYYFLIGLLILTFITYIVTYWTNSVSLFFDIPSVFALLMDEPANKTKSYFFVSTLDVRLFSNILVSIPYNILYQFFKGGLLINLINSYTFSFLIIHFFALVLNFVLARKTKRYDIAIASWFVYFILSMPNMMWAIRECHMVVIFYFILLQYFLSKTKLTKLDLIPITLLLIFLFESYEITFVFGIIIFIFMHLYGKRENDVNIWYKVYIGFGSFLAGIYIPFKLLWLMAYKNLNFTSGYGFQEWINSFLTVIKYAIHSNCLILFFAIIAIIFVLFYKKRFSIYSLFYFVPFLGCLFYILYKQGAYPDPLIELHSYTVLFAFIFPIILFILICDYFNIEKYLYFGKDDWEKAFWPNMLVIVCIFGFINCSWQIYSNMEYGKYIAYLKNLLRTQSSTFVYMDENDYRNNEYIRRNNTCLGLMTRSIFLSETKEINKIICPSEFLGDYNNYCFHEPEYNYLDIKNRKIRIQTQIYKAKTENWNLMPIVREFAKRKMVRIQ